MNDICYGVSFKSSILFRCTWILNKYSINTRVQLWPRYIPTYFGFLVKDKCSSGISSASDRPLFENIELNCFSLRRSCPS